MTGASPGGGPSPGLYQRFRQWLRRLAGRTRFDRLEHLLEQQQRVREAAYQQLKSENDGLRQQLKAENDGLRQQLQSENDGLRRRLESVTEMVETVVEDRLQPLTRQSEQLQAQNESQHQEVHRLVEVVEAALATNREAIARGQQDTKDACVRAVAGQVESLREQCAELRSQVNAVSDGVAGDMQVLGRELRAAVADGVSTNGDQLATVAGRIEALEAEMGSAMATQLDAVVERMDAIGPRLAGLKKQIVGEVVEAQGELRNALEKTSGEQVQRMQASLRDAEERREQLSEELDHVRKESAVLQQAAAARDELEHELQGAKDALAALQEDLDQSQQAVETFTRWRDTMQVELSRLRSDRDRLLRERPAEGLTESSAVTTPSPGTDTSDDRDAGDRAAGDRV